jgi:hypothetical protein
VHKISTTVLQQNGQEEKIVDGTDFGDDFCECDNDDNSTYNSDKTPVNQVAI